MTSLPHSSQRALAAALDKLAALAIVPDALPAMRATADRVRKQLREAILAEVPSFTATANPGVLSGLDLHIGEHVEELLRLTSGGVLPDFGFVRDQAASRAEERFPLEVTLHAYRLGHRILSQWMRDAAAVAAPQQPEQVVAAIADFSIEYTNAISIVAAAEYVARTRLIAEAEGDQRTELLNVLLTGYDESDGRVARLLKRAGYLEQRRAYCVAVSQAVNVSEMEHPERARRIASAIAAALAGTSIRVLTGSRNNMVAAVLSDLRRQSGWTAPQAALADRAGQLLQALGPAVLVGISADHPSTAFLPRAYQEAVTAFDFASVGQRVAVFGNLPLRALLVHRGADHLRATPPPWLAAFDTANRDSEGALAATLRAMAGADMNIQRAARALGRHPNTLYARLERIRAATGLDGQRYADLTELLLAADTWRM